MTGPDWGATYRANIDAVSALAGGLSTEEVALRVPATPTGPCTTCWRTSPAGRPTP